MRRIEEQIAESIRQYAMLEHCNRVIVGFSGGADSMALLHYLHRHFAGEVLAAHVNHCLRGEESDRDEQAVRAFCQAQGIPLQVLQADVGALAKARGLSEEACGRQVRYDFFRSLCCFPTDKIATAHTLSDSGETMLFHLARGTGVRGLQGIPPVRGNIIRPLRDISRQQVERYCDHYHLPYVTDSTNLSDDYSRNRIRHQVLPALEAVCPGALHALARTAKQLQEQEAALSFLAQQLRDAADTGDGYCLSVLRAYPKAAVQQLVVQDLRERCRGDAISDQKLQAIYACIEKGSGGVSVTGTLSVRAEQGCLRYLSQKVSQIAPEIPFAAPQSFVFLDKAVEIAAADPKICKINKNNSNFLFPNALDYDTIPCDTLFRNRRAGDTFRPVGRGVRKSLKKLLQEAHCPASRRDTLLVLADGSDVLWIEGIGPAEGHQVTAQTKTAVTVTVQSGKRRSAMHPDIEAMVLTQAEIAARVQAMGKQITTDCAGQELLVVGVLNGAAFLTTDLVRAIGVPCLVDFIGVSSYGDGTQSGKLTMTKAPSIDPKGKVVLLVEDVLDSGRTLSHLADYYREKGAAEVKICVMLDKPQAHKVEITADYTGGIAGNEFIVGYGLDYAQRYRNLPYIGVLKPEIYA